MSIFTILCKKIIDFFGATIRLLVNINIIIVLALYFVYLLMTAIISDVSCYLKQLVGRNIAYEEEKNCDENTTPIVLVHGVFGFGEGKMGNLSYFGGIEKKYERILVPDLGWLTSIHDRARELFYYLKGGQVDYGEGHSTLCGHAQFGNIYKKGKYTIWDENHPIHFVGHSAGAQVVRVLQQMLADKSFKGYENTCGDWVASLTSLCGALNGSTRTYIVGMKADEWKYTEAISLLGIGVKGLIILEWFDIWWLRKYTNFGFNHFNISWRSIGFQGLVDCLLGNSGPLGTGDWALPDLTLQGSIKINSRLKTFPKTFYLSYAAKVTKKGKDGFSTRPSSSSYYNILLLLQVYQMCLWNFPLNLPPPYNGYRDEDWWDNDGELNTISMTHPRIPTEHFHQFLSSDSELPSQTGIWYYKILKAHHTQFVALSGHGESYYRNLYETIFSHCRNLVTKKMIPTGNSNDQIQT